MDLKHACVTSTSLIKNLALHPPHESALQVAVGKDGQVFTWHGSIRQLTGREPSGQPVVGV